MTTKFTDTKNRNWSLDINIGSIRDVKKMLGVNLSGIADTEGDNSGNVLISRLKFDYELVCNILYCLVKSQADELKINDEEFGRSLGGDSLREAQEALIKELISFFPQPAIRRLIETQMTKQEKLENMAIDAIEKNLNGIDFDQIMINKIDKQTKEMMAKIICVESLVGSTSGNSPE